MVSANPMTMTSLVSTHACGGCGGELHPATALYDKNGDLRCARCSAKDDIAEGDRRASASLWATAFGPLGLAGISLLFNAFYTLSFFSILGAIAWLRASSQAPQFRGWKYVVCVGAVVLGILLALHPIWFGVVRDGLRRSPR